MHSYCLLCPPGMISIGNVTSEIPRDSRFFVQMQPNWVRIFLNGCVSCMCLVEMSFCSNLCPIIDCLADIKNNGYGQFYDKSKFGIRHCSAHTQALNHIGTAVRGQSSTPDSQELIGLDTFLSDERVPMLLRISIQSVIPLVDSIVCFVIWTHVVLSFAVTVRRVISYQGVLSEGSSLFISLLVTGENWKKTCLWTLLQHHANTKQASYSLYVTLFRPVVFLPPLRLISFLRALRIVFITIYVQSKYTMLHPVR